MTMQFWCITKIQFSMVYFAGLGGMDGEPRDGPIKYLCSSKFLQTLSGEISDLVSVDSRKS